MAKKPEDKAAPEPEKKEATNPQKTAPVKLSSVVIKKTIGRKKKQKEVWLCTPFYMQCTDPNTGVIRIDKDGDELAIPLLVCTSVLEAAKIIRKYQPITNIDDEGELTTVTGYRKATPEEKAAYEEEMGIRAKFRAITIRKRKVRDAKHIVQVTSEEVLNLKG